jgi:hypothetical protein
VANNFLTESVVSPGATFASHEEAGAVHHPLAVLEFGPVGGKVVVENAAGKRLPSQADLQAAAVVAGQVSITGISAALPSAVARRFRLKADNDNTQKIFLGPSGVSTSDGFPLSPGDFIEVEVTNLNVIHRVPASGTQTLHYLGLV